VPTRGRDDETPSSPSTATTLVAIGNFDGVHVGHRAVISDVAREAHRLGLAPLVLTFFPHPTEVLGRAKLAILTTLERKLELIRRIDPRVRVVVEPFTLELAKKSPEEFARELIVERLGARVVIVGENFRFGHKRAGDLSTLRELGEKLGFQARALPLSGDGHGGFSSSRIREALARGDLPEVERVLGRPHSLSGVVVQGQARGRTIGFSTANLADVAEALPPFGVYACLVDEIDASGSSSDGRRLPAASAKVLGTGVMNIGVRPTLEAGFSVEVHLFDFDRDLYGRRLRVHLVRHLREERRFDGLPELKRQIELDAALARAAVSERRPDPTARGAWY
jgi:riboflavin kinase / FMN adenylyltransferase